MLLFTARYTFKTCYFGDKLFANITTDSDKQEDTLVTLLGGEGEISVLEEAGEKIIKNIKLNYEREIFIFFKYCLVFISYF